jgi:hypothetical protein
MTFFAIFHISSLLSTSTTSIFSAALLRNTWSTYAWFFTNLRRRALSYVLKSASSAFKTWNIWGYTVSAGKISVSTNKVEAVAD